MKKRVNDKLNEVTSSVVVLEGKFTQLETRFEILNEKIIKGILILFEEDVEKKLS